MNNPKVLLIEDTLSMQLMYKTILERGGFDVIAASTARDGIDLFTQTQCPIVVLDMGLPDQSGTDVMRAILEISDATKIVVITTNGTLTTAVDAMRDGAFDFLVKPMSDVRLVTAVDNAAKQYQAETQKRTKAVASSTAPPPDLTVIRGSSLAITEVRRRILAISKTTAIVFLSGEVGTGKNTAARYVHYESSRAPSTFVSFDVAAIPSDQHRAHLFGTETTPGLVARADQGTLLIDDICDLENTAQASLLRFLQLQHAVTEEGGRTRRLDVRLICATRQDPIAAVEKGQLREDLFYRLHVVPIQMPPFRQRQRDVIEIAQNILKDFAEQEGRPIPELSAPAIDLLLRHNLPGNFQQVLSAMRKAFYTTTSRTIDPEDLGLDIAHAGENHRNPDQMVAPSVADVEFYLEKLVGLTLSEVEYHLVQATLQKYNGAVVKTAEILGVAPSTLYRKLDQWKEENPEE